MAKKVQPFVLDHCTLDSAHFDNVTVILCRPEVKVVYQKEIAALTALFEYYSESERSKKMWDHHKHGNVGKGATANRANLQNMSYKEFVALLTDFGAIPYFITTAQVFGIWRLMNQRTLKEVHHGVSRYPKPDKFKIKADHKGRNWRQVSLEGMESVQQADYDEVQRPDFLAFSQFCEVLGHIAIAAFAHELPEDRLVTLWRWFDQSDGSGKIGKSRSAESGIRFAVRGST
jgi:hypothetical protein